MTLAARVSSICLTATLLGSAADVRAAEPDAEAKQVVAKAIAFLQREVPQWKPANKCFSCHNNGDAAQALMLTTLQDKESLAPTLSFLAAPGRWETEGNQGDFKDTKLATLQFASALLTATQAKLLDDRQAMRQAAEAVAKLQNADGGWTVDSPGTLGSPVTYGPFLATVTARRVLGETDPERFAQQLKQADRWLLAQQPETVFDAAATLLGLDQMQPQPADAQRFEQLQAHCVKILREGELKPGGGWGPYLISQPEAFDTAVVLLALDTVQGEVPDAAAMIARGRKFLAADQYEDGSWEETTRPAGAESYAQRMSTTSWAVKALLQTAPREP